MRVEIGNAVLYHGDCREVLRDMPAESVDAIVTDPPYEIGFMGKQWDRAGAAYDRKTWREAWRTAKPGAHLLAFGGTRTFHRLAVALEDAGWEIRDTIMWLYGSGFPKSHNLDGEWEGWGTALKPAWEPIVLARKPLAGTVAENVRQHGTGALNIDGCRIPFSSSEDEHESKAKNRHADFGSGPMTNQVFGKYSRDRDNYNPPGRWPANVIHDGSDEVVAAFPSPHGAGHARDAIRTAHGAGLFGLTGGDGHRFGDSGSASRFFYCAKATRNDRNEGCDDMPEQPLLWSSGTKSPGTFQAAGTKRSARNNHPTVKPTALMRYLCRLITPPGGIVLDPFMGSGSTGKAAALEGVGFLGIEEVAEYIEIAQARIAFVQSEGVAA